MTQCSRSVVDFGRFFSHLNQTMSSGAPLGAALELVRSQLGGRAAALRIDDRAAPGHEPIFIAEAQHALSDEIPYLRDASRLGELLEQNHHISASATSEASGHRCTLWLFRDLDDLGFDAEDGALCEIVVEQLRRGLELSQRIDASEIERALYSTVMDRLSVGVVIMDVSGRILKCSPKAEESLAERDGVQLLAGKLRATCAKADRELQAAIKAAIHAASKGEAGVARGLALTKLSGDRNLGLIVQPVANGAGTSAPAVAIYIRDCAASADVEGDLVRQLFDLTPAEAAVARRLTAGLSLEDAASSLDISRNTARAHLRSIFSKSGITRQTELVRLMLNSAAVLGAGPRQAA